MIFGKFMKKLVAVLTATSIVTISGLGSVCMAVKDNREVLQTFFDEFNASKYYAQLMLKSIDKSLALKSSDKDGNYFKMDKLSDEEKKVYDQVVAQVRKIEDSVNQDSSSDLPRDCKLAKAIFFWVRNNITYDELSAERSLDENSFEGKLGIKSVYKNRKPQDALTTFKNNTGVCVGFARLAKLMMRIAGLPCLAVGNPDHEFNAVWLDSLGGWAFFDATTYKTDQREEEQESKETGVPVDDIVLNNCFTAISKNGEHNLQRDNGYFLVQGLGDHFVYSVVEEAIGFGKLWLDFDGVCYVPFSAMLMVKSKNDSIFIDEQLIKMNKNCKLEGYIEDVQNFDVFIKNFVKVDVSGCYIKKTLQKDGFEFNLSCDGKQSKLTIKPLNGSVSCDTVIIPDELIPFLADMDVFDVDSSIKTVKYDLLREGHTLKKNAVPNGVNFEQITL